MLVVIDFRRKTGYSYGVVASHPFVALLWTNSSKNMNDEMPTYTIVVRGDAGADGGGLTGRMKGTVSLGEYHLEYDVYQISEAEQDASICEIYFVVHSELWGSILSDPTFYHASGSQGLLGKLEVTGDNIFLGYTLLSKSEGKPVAEREIRLAMQPLLLQLARSVSTDVVMMVDISEDDYAITPSCSLRHLIKQFYGNCLFGSNFLKISKFQGPKGCRSHLGSLVRCANDVLLACTWSVSPNTKQLIDIIKIQKYFEVLWTPKNNSNDILDVFCTHAPLGLQFPHLNSDFLSELCGQNFIVQIRNHLATFYRTYSWARDQEEIYHILDITETRIALLIEDNCVLEDIGSFYEALDVNRVDINEIKNSLRKFISIILTILNE